MNVLMTKFIFAGFASFSLILALKIYKIGGFLLLPFAILTKNNQTYWQPFALVSKVSKLIISHQR